MALPRRTGAACVGTSDYAQDQRGGVAPAEFIDDGVEKGGETVKKGAHTPEMDQARGQDDPPAVEYFFIRCTFSINLEKGFEGYGYFLFYNAIV